MVEKCGVCLTEVNNAVLDSCGHRFCKGCADNIVNLGGGEHGNGTCPICRTDVAKIIQTYD